jgi:hypothetical protein
MRASKHAPDSEPGKRVTCAGAHTASATKNALPSHTQGGSRMPELGPYGSVRGALSNERPYRDLGNVGANYPFEKSRRFAGMPNFDHRDYSRLSCGVEDTQLALTASNSSGVLTQMLVNRNWRCRRLDDSSDWNGVKLREVRLD